MTAAEIIRQHINDDVYTLSAKAHWYESYDKMWLVQQIQARQKAKSKLPSWYGNFDLLFPPPLSVEQCSSELTAAYKASLVFGGTLADVTGGMGIDSSAFARRCSHVVFIEKQPVVADAARHNFNVLGLSNVEVICGDTTELLSTLAACDCIFIDPARRKEGQKVFRLEDCEPDLLQLLPIIQKKCRHLIVKLSPLFDISLLHKQLSNISAIHVVAVHNEVKELLVEVKWEEAADAETKVVCVNLEPDAEPRVEVLSENAPVRKAAVNAGSYLYEPHATVMKAGRMDALAARYQLLKVQENSHLYVSSELHEDFFGRIFQIESVFGMGKAELKSGLADLPAADITVRNFPMSAADLRKRLKLRDGGGTTIFATTLADGRHALLRCKRVRNDQF